MSERLVCKPTPWFLFRAIAMFAMFSVFAVMFFADAKWGYREKNLAFMAKHGFDAAAEDFTKYGSSRESWNEHARGRAIDLGNDPALLPPGVVRPMPWPAQLTDYDKMKGASGNIRPLFDEFRLQNGIKHEPDEHLFDSGKILGQWIFAGVCSAAAVVTLFFFVRTIGRTLAIDDDSLYPPGAASEPIAGLTRLDLRKWDTKGVAFAWNQAGRKIRIDGLVYGGFKKDQGEPAEALMKRLKASFSGEIVQYVTADAAGVQPAAPEA